MCASRCFQPPEGFSLGVPSGSSVTLGSSVGFVAGFSVRRSSAIAASEGCGLWIAPDFLEIQGPHEEHRCNIIRLLRNALLDHVWAFALRRTARFAPGGRPLQLDGKKQDGDRACLNPSKNADLRKKGQLTWNQQPVRPPGNRRSQWVQPCGKDQLSRNLTLRLSVWGPERRN